MRKVLLCLSVVALLVGAGCGDDDDDGGDAADETTSTSEPEVATSEGTEGESLALNAADFQFEPDALSATAGATVTIALANVGEAPHTFTSDELGVDEEVEPGGSVDVEVTMPDEAGPVEFECRFHGGGGMTGTIEVS